MRNTITKGQIKPKVVGVRRRFSKKTEQTNMFFLPGKAKKKTKTNSLDVEFEAIGLDAALT